MVDDSYCTIYLVRHGQTKWNVQKIVQGHSDSPLTNLGKKQAVELGRRFAAINFSAIFSSDLLRAKKTAELLTLEKKLAIQTTKALRERYFGWMEGKKYDTIAFKIRRLLQKYFFLPLFADEETDEQLMSRFISFLRQAAVGYRGKTILVVTHGGVMRTFLIHLGFFSKKDEVRIANLAYLKLLSDGVDFFIKETSGIEKYPSRS